MTSVQLFRKKKIDFSSSSSVIKQTLFAPCTKFLRKEREKQLTPMWALIHIFE